MKRSTTFAAKLLLLTLAIAIADRSIGSLLRHYYYRSTHGDQSRLTYVMDSVTDPVLVLGASRALRQYDSRVIADSLQMACYNTGKDKQSVLYCLAVLKAALLRYHPKCVLLDLQAISFSTLQYSLDGLSDLLPYYHQHPEIRPIVDQRSPFEWLKTQSFLYCYNSLLLPIAFDNITHSKDTGIYNGYNPKHGGLRRPPFQPYTLQAISNPSDSSLVAAFREILDLTLENGGRIAVIVSPLYYALPGDPATFQLAKKICAERNVLFLDYTNEAGFIQNKDLFIDELHMNNIGSDLFTRKLCSDLVARGFRNQRE